MTAKIIRNDITYNNIPIGSSKIQSKHANTKGTVNRDSIKSYFINLNNKHIRVVISYIDKITNTTLITG